MKYEVRILNEADEELDQIYNYLLKTFDDRELASKTIKEIITNIQDLNFYPQKYQIVHTKYYPTDIIHASFVERYVILYKVDESTHQVFVLKICFTSSDWKNH